MVGDDGAGNQVGIAPGARWIGCRNMNGGDGTPASYAECFEWFLAPTDLAKRNPDPALAPDVINNSWGCPPSEGCSADALRQIVEATRAAGIVVVVSAGNYGSSCATVSDPPAIYDASFSVGSTTASDAISSFSSRGPVTIDGSNRMKPDLSAPGSSVRSSSPGNSYATSSGTSMAGPHVAGVIALLLDARPDLRGRVDEIEEIVRRSAVPLTSTQSCGGVSGLAVPNNTFGHGRIDALAMLAGDADADGLANLGDCRPLDATAWRLPGPAYDLSIARLESSAIVTWSASDDPGAALADHDLLRSDRPDEFAVAACLGPGGAGTTAEDPALPPSGSVFFYVVRVSNPCGATAGASSAGAPRATSASCP
jgi:subtilisin family serine protease